MLKHTHSIVSRSWQALLVIALLWAQLASAHHLHLLDADASKGHSITECLTCQQLTNDEDSAYQSVTHLELGQQHGFSVTHYTLDHHQRPHHFAIRAPPQQA